MLKGENFSSIREFYQGSMREKLFYMKENVGYRGSASKPPHPMGLGESGFGESRMPFETVN